MEGEDGIEEVKHPCSFLAEPLLNKEQVQMLTAGQLWRIPVHVL